MKSGSHHRIDKKIKRRLLKWLGWLFSVIIGLFILIFGLLFLAIGLELDEFLWFMFDVTKDVGVVILANVLNVTVGG